MILLRVSLIFSVAIAAFRAARLFRDGSVANSVTSRVDGDQRAETDMALNFFGFCGAKLTAVKAAADLPTIMK